jgi:hypothetical protein
MAAYSLAYQTLSSSPGAMSCKMRNYITKEYDMTDVQYDINPLKPSDNYLHSAFTDKVEHNYHFPAPGRNCYNTGKLILLFLWSDT